MTALLRDSKWFAARLEQERAAAKTLGEVAAMLDQAAKEAVLDAVCRAHAREMYEALRDQVAIYRERREKGALQAAYAADLMLARVHPVIDAIETEAS